MKGLVQAKEKHKAPQQHLADKLTSSADRLERVEAEALLLQLRLHLPRQRPDVGPRLLRLSHGRILVKPISTCALGMPNVIPPTTIGILCPTRTEVDILPALEGSGNVSTQNRERANSKKETPKHGSFSLLTSGHEFR